MVPAQILTGTVPVDTDTLAQLPNLFHELLPGQTGQIFVHA
jgi:hypothetical protein